jgi:hypothetical protein
MDILEQQCRKCGEIKPATDFYPRYHKVNQLEKTCKTCKALITTQNKKNKRNKIQRQPISPILEIPEGKARKCTTCNEVKTLKHFYPSKTAKEGYSTKCAECFRMNYRQNKDNQNMKALQRYYEKQGKPMPEAVKQYNTRIIEANSLIPVRPTINIERFTKAREHWRAVFAERFDDVIQLLRDYEAERAESLNLLKDFHANVRTKWTLKHNSTDKYEEHFKKYGSSCW